VNEAAAAIGLRVIQPQLDISPLYLWPENVASWELFNRMHTQWMSGQKGAVGLNYSGVEIVMKNGGVKKREWRRVFAEIQAMEHATLKGWEERKNG
jgi:hypothetical protein